MMRSTPAALAVLALTAALLAGCSTPSAPAASPTSSAPVESPTPTEPEPSPTPTTVTVDATCENTATPQAIASFAEAGWTAGKVEKPWVIVEDLSAGVACTWGDFTTSTDNIVWFAWAPLPDAQADAVITTFLNQGGWNREDGDGGVYITAADAAMSPFVDDQGYATTYFFADGQVKAASTKAALVSVTAPPGFEG